MNTLRYHIVPRSGGIWEGRKGTERRPLVAAPLDHVVSVMVQLVDLMGGAEIVIHDRHSEVHVPARQRARRRPTQPAEQRSL